MIRHGLILMLASVMLTLTGSSLVAWGQTVPPEPPPLEELCSPSPTPSPDPASVSCAKTGAKVCVCYMSTRTVQSSVQSNGKALVRPVTVARAPRPGRKVRLLPQPQPSVLASALAPAPPTPPPRN